MVNNQFIMMIEHQFTINPNMPFRLLEYVTRIYSNVVDSKSKFSNQLIPHLSDAFNVNQLPNAEVTLELKVKVCKINGKEPSQIVSQYSDLERRL